MFDWLKKLFGGGNDDKKAYEQIPREVKDAVAYRAGVGAGIPGKPETYATTAPIDNILKGYAQPEQSAPVATGGRPSAAAAPDPLPGLRSDATGQIKQINDLYNTLFGKVNNLATERTNETVKNYAGQEKQLSDDYGRNLLQLANVYGARGLGDSSYYTDKKGESAETYNTGVDRLRTAKDSDLATIGRTAATARRGYETGRDQVNEGGGKLGQMDAQGVSSFINQLKGIYSQLRQDEAGLGTTGEFLNTLNSITPYKQTASQQLADRLTALTKSNTTREAKRQIAEGLINLSGANKDDWLRYYKSIGG